MRVTTILAVSAMTTLARVASADALTVRTTPRSLNGLRMCVSSDKQHHNRTYTDLGDGQCRVGDKFGANDPYLPGAYVGTVSLFPAETANQ